MIKSDDIKLHSTCLNYFWIVSTEGLITPIFVPAALSRDVDKPAILVTYCIYHITAVIFSPIIAWNLKHITRVRALLIGILLTSLSFIIFGIADLFDNQGFMACSLFGRVIMGLGNAFVVTTMFAILGTDYQDRLMYVSSIAELYAGFGGAFGRLFGEALYEEIGYMPTFLIYSAVVMISFPLTWRYLNWHYEYTAAGEKINKYEYLFNVPVQLVGLALTVTLFVYGLVDRMFGLKLDVSLKDTTYFNFIVFIVYTMLFIFSNLAQTWAPIGLLKHHPMAIGMLITGLGCWMAGDFLTQAGMWMSISGYWVTSIGFSFVIVNALPALTEVAVIDLNFVNSNKLGDINGGYINTCIMLGMLFAPITGFPSYTIANFQIITFALGSIVLTAWLVYAISINQLRTMVN